MDDKIFKALTTKAETIANSDNSNQEKLQQICDLLFEEIDGYDWVGFYIVDPEKERELVLGPFAGEPTDHVRIPFGKGICGQAAETEKTFIVDDVNAENNYLSCSIHVKSEIVLPIFRNGKVIGELDLDSHETGRFTEKDESFLKKISDISEPLI